MNNDSRSFDNFMNPKRNNMEPKENMYNDIINDGGMDPRNKNDQSMDEMVTDYLIQKVQELMKLKPTNDREFEAVNSFIHSFTDVIWWMQNKNERTN